MSLPAFDRQSYYLKAPSTHFSVVVRAPVFIQGFVVNTG